MSHELAGWSHKLQRIFYEYSLESLGHLKCKNVHMFKYLSETAEPSVTQASLTYVQSAFDQLLCSCHLDC